MIVSNKTLSHVQRVIFVLGRNVKCLKTEQKTIINHLEINIRKHPARLHHRCDYEVRTWSVMMLACERAGDGDHIGKLWSPISLECKWLGVIERYQFICCSLMTHEIKKYLLHRGGAPCVCLEHGYHGDKQSILVTKLWRRAAGGLREDCLCAMQLSASLCVRFVHDIFISVHVTGCTDGLPTWPVWPTRPRLWQLWR